MKGDFTRFRVGNEERYTAVLKQQGRVELDADWNEAEAIEDWQRRQRTIDSIGEVGFVDDGFEITAVPGLDDLAISPGRGYVSGHLVETADDESIEVPFRRLDSDLALLPKGVELIAGDVYRLSTDGPQPVEATVRVVAVRVVTNDNVEWRAEPVDDAAFAEASDDGTATLRRISTVGRQRVVDLDETEGPVRAKFDQAVVVLDVWQRHVTAVEDRDLLEEALGGPDTTTRLETTFAVRLLPIEPGDRAANGRPTATPPTCSDDHSDLIEKTVTHVTTGRLTTRTVPSDTVDDPCLLPADIGYRGLENRLYRIEVHRGGRELSDIEFKWSRHDAAAVAQVEKIDGDTVTVANLGRDDAGLRPANLIELFDIFNERTPTPGLLLQPQESPNESQRTLVFDPDVSTDNGRPWDQPTHRARRWDGRFEDVRPGREFELEDGIQLTFGEGVYQPGDHWLLVARTSTSEIDKLIDAPPVGVKHWAAKLAIVVRGEDGLDTQDCRPCFEPLTEHNLECDPLITVGPCGDVRTLPEAIRRAHDETFIASFAPGTEVTIKLLRGVHSLADSVEVVRSDIRITGCGDQSVIECNDAFSALLIGRAGTDRIERIHLDNFAVRGAAPRGLIAARSVTGLRIERIRAELDFAAVEREGAAAVVTSLCSDVLIEHCDLTGASAIGDLGSRDEKFAFPQLGTVSIDGERVIVARNRIVGAGVWCRHGSRDVRIDDNDIVGRDDRGHSLVASGAGIYLGEVDPSLPPAKDPANATPADFSLTEIHITRNRIRDRSGSGIAILAPDAIKVNYEGLDLPPITVDTSDIPIDDLAGLKWCFPRVTAAPYEFTPKRIAAFAAAGSNVPRLAKLKAALRWSTRLFPNRTLNVGGTAVSARPEPTRLVIRDNEIVGCARSSKPDGRVMVDVHGGIVLNAARNVEIHRNRVLDNGTQSRAVGVWVSDAVEVQLVDNEIAGNGRKDPPKIRRSRFPIHDVVLDRAVVLDVAKLKFFAGTARDDSVLVQPADDPAAVAEKMTVAGLVPGQVLGHPLTQPSTFIFADEIRSESLKMSFLTPATDPSPIEGIADLVDGTRVPVRIDPKKDFAQVFNSPLASLTLRPAFDLFIEAFDVSTEPELVQAGVVVVGLSGFGASGSGQSLTVDRNSVHTPAGPALAAQMVGDGAVQNNLLVSSAYTPLPKTLEQRLGGSSRSEIGSCVAVRQVRNFHSQMLKSAVLGTALTRGVFLLDPSLRFGGNHVQQSASEKENTDLSIPVVLFIGSLDVQFGDNVVEALVARGDVVANVAIQTNRARVVANRFAETPCSTMFSLDHVIGSSSVVNANQADHAVELTKSGASVPLDGSNQTLLAGCSSRPELEKLIGVEGLATNSALARTIMNSFGGTRPGEAAIVGDGAVALAGAISERMTAAQMGALADIQGQAARKLVKAVGGLQLTIETLQLGGIVDPDLSGFAKDLHIGTLALAYEDATDTIRDVVVSGTIRPDVVGGRARFADGAGVPNARLTIERDGRPVEDLVADGAGRFPIDALRRLDTVVRASDTGDLRFVLADENGADLDNGALVRPAADTPITFDFSARGFGTGARRP